jgi:hypothetical protein
MEFMARVQGNRNWMSGQPAKVRPAVPTQFENLVCTLQLSEKSYVKSRELREWCELNRDRCYVPEWLLTAWDIDVNSDHLAI